MIKANELRGKTAAELNKELVDLKEKLFNLRFQHAINQLDNPMQIKDVKRDIARVKTVIRDIEIKESAAKQTEV